MEVSVPQNSGAACNEDVDCLEASCCWAVQYTFDVGFFVGKSDGAELGYVSELTQRYGEGELAGRPLRERTESEISVYPSSRRA